MFMDVIKLRISKMRASWIIWCALNPVTRVLMTDRRGKDTEGEDGRQRQRLERCRHKPRNAWSPQTLGETRKHLFLEPSE